MNIDQQVIDLATGIQRRHDFTAHVIGFGAGAVVLGSLILTDVRGAPLYVATLLTWATALSFQHFRHVLRGPVTADAVRAEATQDRASPRGRPSWRKCGARPSPSALTAMTTSTRTPSRTRHKPLESPGAPKDARPVSPARAG